MKSVSAKNQHLRKMKRSSYPILDNRPIDQWKVTELKEELKKRRLPLKGLKDDLIRRLADDIEADEQEQEKANEVEVVDVVDNIPPEVQNDAQQTPTAGETRSQSSEPEDVVEAVKDTKEDIGNEVTKAGDVLLETPTVAGESPTAKEVAEAANDEEPLADSNVSQDSGIPLETEIGKEPGANKILREASEPEKEVVATESTDADVGIKTFEGSDDGLKNSAGDTDSSVKEPTGNEILSEATESKIEVAREDMEADVGSKITQGADYGSKNSVGHGDSSVKDATKVNSVEMQEAAHAPTSGSVLGMQGSESGRTGKINLDSCSQIESQKPNEDIKLQHEGVKHNLHDINNQVSVVSPSLGLPVKNDSISTDSMSVNQNLNALKDNIIADDDVKLEPDVKPEMVQPSSSHVVSVSGESHPMDVEAPHENKVSMGETDNNVTNVDIVKKNSIVDLGSPEKLNLDRSSGDDSMEEDTLENKQVVSAYNSEIGERSVKDEVPIGKDENVVDVVVDVMSTDTKDNLPESNSSVAAATEKRKFPDQEAISSNEPSKRQRRWTNEKVAAVELQNSSTLLPTTPREASHSHAPSFKRSLSRNNSNTSAETLKERVVPPAAKTPTDSLRIDNFLRPFTLKAVQELLGKTGSVTSFWMDHIKTHCYVTYSSVEEAIETRNAVYNLQWPPNGGKFLAAEFVDSVEVKARLEGPPPTQPPAAPVTTGPPAAQALPSPRQQLGTRLKQPQPQPQQPVLPPPPPISNVPHMARERVHLPPPPPLPEKMEPPIVTLDDLFRKTKTTPRIYYLPLSDEQVKAKSEARSRNSRQ